MGDTFHDPSSGLYAGLALLPIWCEALGRFG